MQNSNYQKEGMNGESVSGKMIADAAQKEAPDFSFKDKTALILNSGSPKKRFIFQKAKKLGAKIVLMNKEKNWAARYADFFIEANTYDHQECLEKLEAFIRDQKIDGVVTFWEDDVPLLGRICDKFKFPGLSYRTSINCRNKYRMREILAKSGIGCPNYALIKRNKVKESCQNLRFPAVLKPLWGAMSQFVVRADNIEEAERVYSYIKSNIGTNFDPIYFYGKEIMAEEYLAGAEVDVDLLVQNGEIKFSSITDNFPTQEPFFVEKGDTIPSILSDSEKENLLNLAEKVVGAFKITNSAVHLEAKVASDGPKIIEVNARMGGDYIYDWIRNIWDVDMIEEILKISFGAPIEPRKFEKPRFHLVGEYIIPESSGVIAGITRTNQNNSKDENKIHDIQIFKEVGDAILVPPEGFEYVGWVVGKGNNYFEAAENARSEISNIKLSIVKFDSVSAVGKTKRKNRFSEASIMRERILQSARIEKIRRVNITEIAPLHIGVLCNKFEPDNENEESAVRQDLTSVGMNIKKALENKGHRATFIDMNEMPLSMKKIARVTPDLIFNVCERINNSSLLEPHSAAILDCLGVPYTGSNPLTLAMAIDKIKVKKLLEYHDIPTPKFDYVFDLHDEVDSDLKYPLIVKPANTDNSIGITNESVVTNEEDLKKRIKYVLEEQKRPALIEEYIEGDEVDVSILGNEGNVKVLPLRRAIFDDLPQGIWHIYPFAAKWSEGETVYKKIKVEWPAQYSQKLTQLISEIALDAYNILDCHDYGRIEVRVDKDGNPFVIEVNPNPSINSGDAVARAAELIGLSYEDFIEEIVKLAIVRYKEKPPYYHLQSSVTFL